MCQPSAEAPSSNRVNLKFQPKPPNRRPKEERDRIQKKAEEDFRQKMIRERLKSLPCRFYWSASDPGVCKKGHSCEYSHEVMPERLKRKAERQNQDQCYKCNFWDYKSDEVRRKPERHELFTNVKPNEGAPDFDEQQVEGSQVQNPRTPKCRYYNTSDGCKKGEYCSYQHIDRRPPPPPLEDETTTGGLCEARVLTREEHIQDNDPDLWNIILEERARLQQEAEHAKKDSDIDIDEFQKEDPDEIGIDDVKAALAGWRVRSVSSKADRTDYEDDRGDFDKIFASIQKEIPIYLQKVVKDNCLDQIIWKSLNLQTRHLMIGKSFNNQSHLLDLPDARLEKGKGWYLGVVSNASDRVEEDYLGLYVGQSAKIARRVQHHLHDRYTKESFQYQTTRRRDKRVQYVTLGVISAEGLDHEAQRILLNCGELLLCLFFQTLPQIHLSLYLSPEEIREPWIGLNCRNPIRERVRGWQGWLPQAPDRLWAFKDVPKAARIKRQEDMSRFCYLQYIMSRREAFGTYTWAREADLRHGDDPAILVQCGRCEGQPQRERAPLYARDGRGYILTRRRCNNCCSSGKEKVGLTIFYPMDPRVPHIRLYRIKAEYGRSHPELKDADLEGEDGEVSTNAELDEAKQIHRESLDIELEDTYLQNADWEEEERMSMEQEAVAREGCYSYSAGEFEGSLREKFFTNRSIHCLKPAAESSSPRVWVRELHINLPTTTDVHKEVLMWCDLRPEGSEHPQACAINTEDGDPARRLGIRITYFDINTKSQEVIWCYLIGEKNTKKLNSLVDFLSGKTKHYTRTQSRRHFRNRVRGMYRAEYTSERIPKSPARVSGSFK